MGKPLAGSVRIPLIYVVVGLVWIVLSSIWVRDALVIDAELLKGSAFVLVTAAGLAFLLRRDEARELELRDTVELAESRLAAGDSLIRAIESAVPSGIVTFDREGRVRSWSPSMSRLLGWSAEERVGEQLPGLRAANRTELVRIVGRVSSTGMPARLNVAVSRNDGTDADLVCEFAVLSHDARFSDDAPVIAALTDISEIEGLRREVADVAERWRLGVEAVGEGVLDWDLASGQVSLSPRARALIGAPSGPATFAPSDLWEFVWEADAPAIRASRDRLLDTHGTEQLTFRVHSRQHAFRWLRQTAVVALDADGRPRRIVAALRDETPSIFAEGIRAATTRMHEDLLAGVPYAATAHDICRRVLAPFNLSRAEVWSQTGDGRGALIARADSGGPDGGSTISLPIRSANRVVGMFTVMTAGQGETDPRLLTALEGVAGGLGAAESIADARERVLLNDVAVASSANGIAILDAGGRVVQANAACASMLRRDPDTLVGMRLESLMEPEEGEHDTSQSATGPMRRDFVVRQEGGSVHLHMTRSPIADAEGTATHTVAVLEDLSERRRQEERIAHLARYDALTDLPNRQLFVEQARGALARAERAGQQVGILFLDLDHFKHINDALGHAVGDSVLRATATRLSAQLRPGDVVARFGGDEFVILLASLHDSGEAGALAQRLLTIHEDPIAAGGILHHVGVSVGIALFPDDGRDLDDLLQHADLAMYRAKSDGRQTFHFFHRQMDELAVRRGSIERALHSALAHNEFRVVYQPQLRLSDGALIGAEALIRWRSRELGDVSPSDFIPVAENLGIIRPIGAQVLARAARQTEQWGRAQLGGMRIAVNLSMAQFRANHLAEELTEIVAGAGLSPAQVELELTESMLAEDAERAERSLRTLHASGFLLAIDDFGTGYSSMFALQRYPLARLKIDRSFVKDVGTDANSATIVRATVELAHALGLSVIAEGVETEVQERFLRGVGCDEVQGFRYARPMEVPDFETWARRFRDRSPGDGLVLPAS